MKDCVFHNACTNDLNTFRRQRISQGPHHFAHSSTDGGVALGLRVTLGRQPSGDTGCVATARAPSHTLSLCVRRKDPHYYSTRQEKVKEIMVPLDRAELLSAWSTVEIQRYGGLRGPGRRCDHRKDSRTETTSNASKHARESSSQDAY